MSIVQHTVVTCDHCKREVHNDHYSVVEELQKGGWAFYSILGGARFDISVCPSCLESFPWLKPSG